MRGGLIAQKKKKRKEMFTLLLNVKASKFDANSSRMETLKTMRLFINPPGRAMFWFAVMLVWVYQIQARVAFSLQSMQNISVQNILCYDKQSMCVLDYLYTGLTITLFI